MLLNLIKPILFSLDTPLYVETSPERLFVKNMKTGAIFDQKPLVALSQDNAIVAYGNAALVHQLDIGIRVKNPFDHPRLPFSNFEFAEKLLQHAIEQTMAKSILLPAPKIMLRPLHNLQGGLADIEIRALKELCFGVGARDALIYHGESALL